MIEGIIVKVLIGLLSMLSGWLVRHWQEWFKDKKEGDADEKNTADAEKELEDAKTKQELEDAAKSIADNFGKHP